MKHRIIGVAAAIGLAATTLGVAGGTASAAFTSCPYGPAGSGGRVCLWTSPSSAGNPSAQYAGTATGLSVNAGSFGNRISNRCAVYYQGTTIVATASPNTGNSWGGATKTINSIDVSVC